MYEVLRVTNGIDISMNARTMLHEAKAFEVKKDYCTR